jgi:cellulose synthase/poly-beta-1,6-N-acetylglucosamine synthase-like glycosyltransferase
VRIKKSIEILVFLGAALIFFTYSGSSATKILSFDLVTGFLSIQVQILQAVLSVTGFTIFMLISALLLAKRRFGMTKNLKQSGPEFTVIIPVYKDAEVLENSVESIMNSNYSDFNIKIICEQDDELSKKEAKRLSKNENVDFLISRDGSKAEAINKAFENSNTEYYAIFDADEVADPDFLSEASYHLETYDGFQARRIYRIDGFIEALSYSSETFNNLITMILRIFRFRFIGSSASAFTKSAYEQVGGYEDKLTEDIDFAHKFYRNNLQVKFSNTCPSIMEAPHTIRDFWGQKKRWMMGMLEVAKKSLKIFLKNPDHRNLFSLIILGSGSIGTILAIGLIANFSVLFFFDLKLFYLIPITVLAALTTFIGFYDRIKHNIGGVYYIPISILISYILLSLVALKSLIEYSLNWEREWYHVDKKSNQIDI